MFRLICLDCNRPMAFTSHNGNRCIACISIDVTAYARSQQAMKVSREFDRQVWAAITEE